MRHGRTPPLRLTIKLSNHMETPTHAAPPVDLDRLVLPFELALTRWSVVCIIWRDLASDHPNLTAFLAGWGCRCIGAAMPETIETFRDSFRVGWREADDQITIASRQNISLDSAK